MPATTYLDHHATTRLRPEALEAMLPWLSGPAANPSSAHAAGREARRAVEEARERTAALLGARPAEVVFTSGGTESDALALWGAALSVRASQPGRTHVVFGAAEHPAVREAALELGRLGFAPLEIPVDCSGRPDPAALAEGLDERVAVASFLLANHEIGSLTDVGLLAERARARGAVIHTDAVQAVGKVSIDFRRLGVDLLSLSAHKLGGPKGVGALIVRSGVQLSPTAIGGGQERGRRGGTENVPGIVGLAAALERAVAALGEEEARLRSLQDRLEGGVRRLIPSARVNGSDPVPEGRLPTVSSITFPGIDGEVLLAALDLEGIAASRGSACHAGTTAPSRVLLACGLSRAEARSTLRFSLGWDSRPADVERLLAVLPILVERARVVRAA